MLSRLDWKIDEALIPDVQRALSELEFNDSIKFQTSGSTGAPKPIQFTLDQIKASAARTAKAFTLDEGAVVFCALPAIYVAGKMMMFRSLFQQWQLHWQKPSALPEPQGKFDFGVFTVAQVVGMLERDIHSLNGFTSVLLGGGSITPRAKELLGLTTVKVFMGYGMTETLTHIALMEVGRENVYSVLPEVEIKVNEQACLMIKDNLLKLDWFTTNDVVELEGNTFEVKGRIDFVINTGGVKIFPEKLEEKLSTIVSSPFFVTGVPDEKYGQRITVVIEGEEDDGLRADLVNLRWGVETPREVIFKSELSRTASGKIMRML
jgi:O-succinylbenzoic acid--CoA ligase